MPHALQSIFAHKPVERSREEKEGHHQACSCLDRLADYPSHCISSSHATRKQFPCPIMLLRSKYKRRKGILSLLAHRRGSALAEISSGGLGFGDTLGENLSVLVLGECQCLYSWKGGIGVGKRTAASLVRSALRRLSAIRWRLCWRR